MDTDVAVSVDLEEVLYLREALESDKSADLVVGATWSRVRTKRRVRNRRRVWTRKWEWSRLSRRSVEARR